MNSLELLFDGIKIESPCVVDPSLLQEFQQGNFRNLWEYKGTTEELTKVLLANPETSEDLKVSMLKTLAKNVRAILKAPENLSKELEKPLDEQKSLDEQKLSHEEAVRNLLKESFDHEKHLNREQLLARGISSLEEFYTTYWEWGESLLLQKTAPLLKKEETDEICYTAEEKLNYIAKCKESLELANLSESKKDEIMNLFYRLLNGYDFSKNNWETVSERYEHIDYTDEEARKRTTWNEDIKVNSMVPTPVISSLDPTLRWSGKLWDIDLLKEFQQGNFRNLWDCRHTMAEITNTLLSSPETDIKLKISMLKTMIKNVKAMTGFTASSLRVKSVQEHNDEVRSNLSLRFQTMKKNSPEQLEKLWLTSWNKFNNYYFWQSGGLSLNEVVPEETSVVYQENQENIENYIISLKEFLEMADLPAQEKKNIKHLLFKFFASEKDQNRYEIEERYTSLHYASEEQRKQTTWNEKISTSSPQYGGQIHQEVRRVVKPADSKKEKKAEEVLKVPEEVLEKPEEVLEKPEEIVEKEKVESGCILSNELIDTLSNEGNVVLECLAEFCATDKKTLLQVLHQRNTPAPNPSRQKFIPGGYLSFGYRKYQKKVNTKFRTLRTPSKELMQIQETLRKRFMCIPVSLKSQAGKPGDSSEKNAELHRYHPYLITLDIKSAYPSITTERVYKNLKGALERTLDIWTPLLISEDLEQTEKNKDLFIRAITHLCVSENELPQWAPTSNQIQNIVMRGFDSKIERRLPELNDPIPSYSRYADDIAISFDQYTTKSVLEEKLETYFERIQQCGKEDLVLIQEHMDKIMQQFMQEKFIITDRSERKYLMEYIGKLKKLVHSLPLSDQLKYLFIGNLNTYGKKIGFSQWRIEEIKEEISKIITDEGRTLSPRKIRVWTPLTNADREINGIVFDKTGKRGLSTKKQSEYKRLLKDLLTCSLWRLATNPYYYRKFKLREDPTLSISIIYNTLTGVYAYLQRIYGEKNVPKEFQELYIKAKDKRKNYTTTDEDPRAGLSNSLSEEEFQWWITEVYRANPLSEQDIPYEEEGEESFF